MHLDDVPRRHDLTGVLQPFLYFLSSFLVSDGLTAGLKWEKANCFVMLLSPLCISRSLLSVVLLAGLGVKLLEVLGWIKLHFALAGILFIATGIFSVFLFLLFALSFACRE